MSGMKSLSQKLAVAAAFTVLAASPSHATFIKDPAPAGDQLYVTQSNSNVNAFTANVGGAAGPAIGVATTGYTQTGSGFAIIKPYRDSLLTQAIFTPLDSTLFSAFNFRGQLASDGFDGIVNVSVTSITDLVYNFTYSGLAGPNSDFASIGIYSLDGDTIKSVTIAADAGESFKSIKQIQFVDPPAQDTPTPVPEPSSLALFGAGLLALTWFARRKVSLFPAR